MSLRIKVWIIAVVVILSVLGYLKYNNWNTNPVGIYPSPGTISNQPFIFNHPALSRESSDKVPNQFSRQFILGGTTENPPQVISASSKNGDSGQINTSVTFKVPNSSVEQVANEYKKYAAGAGWSFEESDIPSGHYIILRRNKQKVTFNMRESGQDLIVKVNYYATLVSK